jgi:hypothetical protein
MRGVLHLFAVGIVAGLASGGPAPAQAPDLKKLHILMVFDTNARDLAKSLSKDKRRMLLMWNETVPQRLREIKVLEGDKANRQEVLAYYQNLQVAPNEGLVFYYAGHGARDKETSKPFFEFRQGGNLLREDLIRAMEAKKAGLAVLLTDCCSTEGEYKEESLATDRGAGDGPRPATSIHPTVRCLLFRSRGTVDITAATDNASWSDNLQGGIFTRTVCRLLKEPVKRLDKNKDQFVSWLEFYPQLKDETQYLFGDWRRQMIARGEKVDERKQVPHAFGLGKVFAVVGIENQTKKTLEYQCRWPGEEWTKVRLAPGQKKVHTLPLPQGATALPSLETKFDFMSEPRQLPTQEVSGTPEPARLKNQWRIRPRES